jgi:proteasome lid subunit RPN8/RPN11
MLYLDKEKAKKLIEHAKREGPDEACGILAGAGSQVKVVYEMTNTDKSATTFFMDPKEQLGVLKKIRNASLEMVGIYHSHPHTEAYPSAHDIEMAFYPEASYVIVSLKDGDNPALRSFKIRDANVEEEKLEIE